MELQLFNYNGNNVSFRKENDNVFINATEMAKNFDRQVKHWFENPSTHEYIHALAKHKGLNAIGENPTSLNTSELAKNYPSLLFVVKGGLNQQGTWMHEDVALEFARWLNPSFAIWCNDRIKELLKYGITATPQTLENLVSNPDLLIDLATALKHERAANENLAIRNQQQSLELKKQAPKVDYFDEVLQSQSTYNTNQIAKELGTSAVSLNKFLAKQKIQYKQGETWLLYHQFQNKGYTKTRTHPYTGDNGEIKTRMLTVWTEAGRLFIHKVFEKHSEQFGNFLIR